MIFLLLKIVREMRSKRSLFLPLRARGFALEAMDEEVEGDGTAEGGRVRVFIMGG